MFVTLPPSGLACTLQPCQPDSLQHLLRGEKNPNRTKMCPDPGEANFIKTLVHFDKDNISDRVLKKIGQYCRMSDFQPDIIGKVSLAAKSLCMWVRAMEVPHRAEHLAIVSSGASSTRLTDGSSPPIQVYGRIYRVVEPKRMQLNAAKSQLDEKQAALAEAQSKLREVPSLQHPQPLPHSSPCPAWCSPANHTARRWRRNWTR